MELVKLKEYVFTPDTVGGPSSLSAGPSGVGGGLGGGLNLTAPQQAVLVQYSAAQFEVRLPTSTFYLLPPACCVLPTPVHHPHACVYS